MASASRWRRKNQLDCPVLSLTWKNADQGTMEGDILRRSNPTMDIVDGNTIVNNQILDPAGQEKRTSQTHLLSRNARIEAHEPRLKTAACVIGQSMPAEKQNSQEKDGAAAHGNGSELRRRDMESLSASPKPHQNGILARSISSAFQNSEKQSPCSPTEEDTGFCPVLDQPSVVISNFRPQERGTKDSRDRDEYLSDDSSDDPDDPDDADYVRESGEDAHGNSVSSHRLKRASRPAVRLKPRSPRHNTERLSVGEALQSKVVADQTSTTSLHDIETIPIRGFLTRRYFCQGSYIQLPLKNRQSIPALGNQAELRHIMKTKLAASILSNPPEKGPALGKRPGQPDVCLRTTSF
ncbi:hypothetical protein N7505_007506 [Penicillium chrysogenum]|uniref:Uncharacterized protein n=1 Tax=Penicillium chrysogenum TaxID=5076 RepID=A0ABQ8WEB6_PENCH|nr:hypothetical protein N7505_007506 [Penicillium chrysogenum]